MSDYYLFVWAKPKVRSARQAQDAVSLPNGAFGVSSALATVSRVFGGRDGVRVVPMPGKSEDRALMLVLQPTLLSAVGPELRNIAATERLVLFDPQLYQLVIPSGPGDRPWPRRDDTVAGAIREIAQANPTTGSEAGFAFESALRRRFAVAQVEHLFPGPAASHIEIPRSLRFLVPPRLPLERQSRTRLSRLRRALEADSPDTRRTAAWELGGWAADPAVDSLLAERLDRDSDIYVRAIAALSLSLRSVEFGLAIRNLAVDLVDGDHETHRWSRFARDAALLAAGIGAVRRRDAAECAWIRELLSRDLVDAHAETRDGLRLLLLQCPGAGDAAAVE